jgi:hypothetical protein
MSDVTGGHANQPLADVMLRRAKAAHVRTVVVGGAVVVDEGRFVGRDPEALREQLIASMAPASAARSPVVGQLKQVVRDLLKSHDPTSS